jgi:hypothetical protein
VRISENRQEREQTGESRHEREQKANGVTLYLFRLETPLESDGYGVIE